MTKNLKIIFINISLNFLLFLFLMITTQNSIQKQKIKFFSLETIYLPTSFIVGSSFISGSIYGSIIPLLINKNNRVIKQLNNFQK